MSMHAFWKRHLLTAAIAGSVSLFAAGNCPANEWGGELPCDCQSAELDGCDGIGHGSRTHLGACFSKGLRQFHHRWKSLCQIDWLHGGLFGHSDACCDDACDAALMSDLMISPPPMLLESVEPHVEAVPTPPEDVQETPEVIDTPPGQQGNLRAPVRVRETMTHDELFKSLPDPFQDDSAQTSVIRSVQPSSHSVDLKPAPKRAFSTNQVSSRRRAANSR